VTEVELGQARIPIRATLDKLDRDLADARQKTESSVGDIAKKVAGLLGSALAGIGVAKTIQSVGRAIRSAGEDIDAAYDTILIKTGATGEALEGLQGDFRAVFGSIPVEAQAAADVISELNRRMGMSGEPAQELAKQILRLSDMLDTDAATTAANFTRTLGDAGIATEDASATLDKLFLATQRSGVGIESLMQLMVQYGAPMRQMGFTVEDSIALLAKWEKEGVNTGLVLGSLRIAAGKFAREGRPLRASLLQTIEAIQGAADASEALNLGMEVFGARAGPDMVAAIREGRFDIESFVTSLQDAEGAIMAAASATDDWPQKLKVLKNQITTALAPLGLMAMDWAGRAVEWLAAQDIPAKLERITSWVATASGQIADFFAEPGDIGEKALRLVGSMSDKLLTALGASDWSEAGSVILDKISEGIIWTAGQITKFSSWALDAIGAESWGEVGSMVLQKIVDTAVWSAQQLADLSAKMREWVDDEQVGQAIISAASSITKDFFDNLKALFGDPGEGQNAITTLLSNLKTAVQNSAAMSREIGA